MQSALPPRISFQLKAYLLQFSPFFFFLSGPFLHSFSDLFIADILTRLLTRIKETTFAKAVVLHHTLKYICGIPLVYSLSLPYKNKTTFNPKVTLFDSKRLCASHFIRVPCSVLVSAEIYNLRSVQIENLLLQHVKRFRASEVTVADEFRDQCPSLPKAAILCTR